MRGSCVRKLSRGHSENLPVCTLAVLSPESSVMSEHLFLQGSKLHAPTSPYSRRYFIVAAKWLLLRSQEVCDVSSWPGKSVRLWVKCGRENAGETVIIDPTTLLVLITNFRILISHSSLKLTIQRHGFREPPFLQLARLRGGFPPRSVSGCSLQPRARDESKDEPNLMRRKWGSHVPASCCPRHTENLLKDWRMPLINWSWVASVPGQL